MAKLADKPTTARANFDLSADQHVKLKMYATCQGKTIRKLLSDYIDSLPE